MITEEIVDALDVFIPVEEAEAVRHLYEILTPLKQIAPNLRAPVIPAILGLIERHPEAELGSPGPLVHELEAIPGYEPFLMDSVLRQPAELNVWMVNRILNSEIPLNARSGWLKIMQTVLTHPLASNGIRKVASDFLEHQR